MGILIDGELYTGQNGYAGEFGHTILFPDGRPCPCGNHGCSNSTSPKPPS